MEVDKISVRQGTLLVEVGQKSRRFVRITDVYGGRLEGTADIHARMVPGIEGLIILKGEGYRREQDWRGRTRLVADIPVKQKGIEGILRRATIRERIEVKMGKI